MGAAEVEAVDADILRELGIAGPVTPARIVCSSPVCCDNGNRPQLEWKRVNRNKPLRHRKSWSGDAER